MPDSAQRTSSGELLEFRLPDLGEGLADAELVSWSVREGEMVELNQPLVDVETAKAVVSVPSPYAGRVAELLAQPGETVAVGAVLIRIATDSDAGADAGAAAARTTTATASDDRSRDEAANGNGRTAVLVGYGPEEATASRRRRRPRMAPSGPQDATPDPAQGSASTADFSADPAPDRDHGREPIRAAATPAARKLARELGLDLWDIAGSGPEGAVTADDVRSAIPVSKPGAPSVATHTPRPASEREDRTPVTGIRKRTAAAMVVSATTIPQATTSVTVDVTASMELLEHLRGTDAFADLSLTPLALVSKAVLAAIGEFPGMNAAWDEQAQEIITKRYVHLGIAVAAEQGLLVPSIKDAHAMSLRDLCVEITRLARAVRAGTATPAELTGGTFTLSNVGVFGVDTGIPLVNPGQAAILCIGSINKRPWVFQDELAIRWVTTLSVSFDHRMIDGEQAARFLATTAGFLRDPLSLLSRL